MSASADSTAKSYWGATLKLLMTTLVVWFVCSYVAGIFLVDALNSIHLGGYPLGFWFAQQGAIYIFLGLIFWYAAQMNKIDREHDVHED